MGFEQHFVVAGLNAATGKWEQATTCDALFEHAEWTDFASCQPLHDWIVANCDQKETESGLLCLLRREDILNLMDTTQKVLDALNEGVADYILNAKDERASTISYDYMKVAALDKLARQGLPDDLVDKLELLLPDSNQCYDSLYHSVVLRIHNACNLMRTFIPDENPPENLTPTTEELASLHTAKGQIDDKEKERDEYQKVLLRDLQEKQVGSLLGGKLALHNIAPEFNRKSAEWEREHGYHVDADPFDILGIPETKKYLRFSWAYVAYY